MKEKSFLMKWMFGNEQIKRKDFIIAFIASVLIAPVKVVYGLFLFLYWFIPVESFGSKRNKIIGVLIITAPAIYELSILLFPLIFRILRKIYEIRRNLKLLQELRFRGPTQTRDHL